MREEEQDVVLLEVVVLLEMVRVAYSGYVALFVLDNVSASHRLDAALTDLVRQFAHIALAAQRDSMVLLLMIVVAVAHYSQVLLY